MVHVSTARSNTARSHTARGAAAAALLLAASVAAGPAAAASGLTTPSAPRTPAHVTWEPYRTAPFEAPAGSNCTFTLRGEPVVDEEKVATWSTYPDGSPRWQTIRGDLQVRYTNVESGASVVKVLDGVGTIHSLRDGSTTLYLAGKAAVGFNQTDPYPAGFYALDGFHVVHTAPERASRTMVVDRGSERDVCAELD